MKDISKEIIKEACNIIQYCLKGKNNIDRITINKQIYLIKREIKE